MPFQAKGLLTTVSIGENFSGFVETNPEMRAGVKHFYLDPFRIVYKAFRAKLRE